MTVIPVCGGLLQRGLQGCCSDEGAGKRRWPDGVGDFETINRILDYNRIVGCCLTETTTRGTSSSGAQSMAKPKSPPIDRKVSKLIAALNRLPGVATSSSCGGHD